MNVRGKHVVVTGKVEGESRRTAEAKLTEAGAIVQGAVSGSTDLLVTGVRVGKSKTAKAEALGVEVVPWEQVWNGSGGFDAADVENGPHRDDVPDEARPPARVIAPMLCKKADEVPSGEAWLHEVKWDGNRCVATVDHGQVTMKSRSAKTDWEFPKVEAELAERFADTFVVLDGEAVTIGGADRFVVFDVLAMEPQGYELMKWPTSVRRQLLEDLLGPTSIGSGAYVAVSPAWDDGAALLEYVREQQLEGIVSKLRSGPYREGYRGDEWLKIKVRPQQEFVVVGWVPGEGECAGMVGSFALAVNGEHGLVYAGRCGACIPFDDEHVAGKLVEAECPLVVDPPLTGKLKSVTWVEPKVVVEVAFQKWTEDGRLWHPSFQRFRVDKAPGEVVRET